MLIRNNGRASSKPVHSGQLERWLGAEQLERISLAMRTASGPHRGFPGPPIAVSGVPGAVYVDGQGDFVGNLRAGYEASAYDYVWDMGRRWKNRLRRFSRRNAEGTQLNMALASLNDLIRAGTLGGRRYKYLFQKTGTTNVVDACATLWSNGAQPAGGSSPASAPGGTSTTDASTGGFPFTNPASGLAQYFLNSFTIINNQNQTLMLYDRLFHVNKSMSSTATEAVTGTFSRYQNGDASADDYIGGNFLFIECAGALSATAHNWTVCQYTNQDSTAAQSFPSMAGISSCITNRLDMPLGIWAMPLASGDVGIKALTQMQCSASITGTIFFAVGHPIAFFGCPVANLATLADGVSTAFKLVRIQDDACLSFLQIRPGTTVACTYNGYFNTVSG
jgi:hypothetical protein